MLENSHCPYCCVPLNTVKNALCARSVEHLVPNTLLTNKRTNAFGDFYACRQCNTEKGKLDQLFGIVAKAQSENEQLAVETMLKAAIGDKNGRNPIVKVQKSISNGQLSADGFRWVAPLTAENIKQYGLFLAKGQYFLKNRKILFDKDLLVISNFVGKEILNSFKTSYKQRHGSDCFVDLRKNHFSNTLSQEEVCVYSKNSQYMFVFHDSVAITIRVLKRNQKNLHKKNLNDDNLFKNFG